jgi:hypothetical protein
MVATATFADSPGEHENAGARHEQWLKLPRPQAMNQRIAEELKAMLS